MKKYPFVIAVLFIIIAGCTVKDPVQSEDNAAPSLSALRLKQNIYVFQDTLYPVSVKVTDPQGTDDIIQVLGSIQQLGASSGKQVEFRDDGQNGDIIPKDGIYYLNLLLEDFNSGAGTYLFR